MRDQMRRWLRRACGDFVLWGLRRFGSRPFALTDAATLIVAPHPDDETLGCGGLIALKRARGAPVHVVILTDGGDARTRYAEARAALAVLGVAADAVTFFGLADGSLSDLADDKREEVIGRLSALLQAEQPGEVFVTHRADVHPDHEAAFRLVQEARAQSGIITEVWQYVIWMFWWKPIPFLTLPLHRIARAYRLPIAGVLNKKRLAIAQHPSQLTEHVLPNLFLKRFFAPDELFFGTES